jgi:uncharacterized RDD family membrane protein YckC
VPQGIARFLWGEEVAMSLPTPPPPPVWSDGQPAAAAGTLGPPAGFWIRFVAFLIDGLILTVIAAVIVGVAGVVAAISFGLHRDKDENVALIIVGVLLGVIAMLVIGWLYEALMTSGRHGATFGKRALGLRIVRADGAQLSFGRATARHFLKALITPMVPFAVGYLLAAFTKGKRALHDFMADTFVIKTS